MKKIRIAALLMTLIIIIGYFFPLVTVKANNNVIDVTKGTSKIINSEPGKKMRVRIPITALISYISRPTIYVSPPQDSPYTAGAVTLKKDNTEGEINYITSYDTTYIEFDIEIKETVKIGYYDLPVIIEYEDVINPDGGMMTTKLDLKIHITKEKKPAQLTLDKVEYKSDDAFIGNTFDIKFTIKNEGEITALNTYFSIDFGGTGLSPAYTVDSRKLGDLAGGAATTVTLPVTVLPTAEEGFKTLSANFSYKDIEGTSGSDSRSIFVTVQKSSEVASENAKLIISGGNYQENIKTGTELNLSAMIENVGAKTASNVKVSIIEGIGASTGILPNFTQSDISLPNLQAGEKELVDVPLIISSGAGSGLHEITLQVSYTGSDGVSRSSVTKAYLVVEKPADKEEDTSGLDFSNVSQSPSQPIVGEKITLTFTITNIGNSDINDIRLWGEDLSSSNFEPLNSEPYQREGSLKAGEKKQVSMSFYVGTMINEGLNSIKIGYSYNNADAVLKTGSVSLHVLNVKNDSNSKPKIILTDFSVDSEELKAGSVFILSFDLKNTHISKAARNIKITLNSANDVFSASKGSNSFYVDKIDPSEVYTGSIELKVKADVATGAHELEIKVEYEYDNMSASDIEKGGVTELNPIKLQAVENSRPVIQNTNVYNWYDGVIVNQTSTIQFNFINMGKSMLNNVYFTLEGDFVFASDNTAYYGSMSPGNGEFLEYDVIPLKDGICSGFFNIHFEDSNGNQVVIKSQEFTDVYVQPEPDNSSNITFPDDGYIPTDVLPQEEVKKNIMELWLFIVIQAAIAVVVIPVVRIIIIKGYKRKLLKNDET